MKTTQSDLVAFSLTQTRHKAALFITASSVAKIFAMSLVATAMLCSQTHAAVTLTINTATQEYSFSGLDSGTPGFVTGTVYNMRWEFGTNTGGVSDPVLVTTGLDVTGLTPPNQIFQSATLAAANTLFTLNLNFTSNTALGLVDFAGNGNTFSYAGLDQTNKNFIATLTNSDTLTPTRGTGISPVQLNMVVPEPSRFALLGLGCLGLLRRRR